MMKNIGKPCAGKPHARFDEGREVQNLLPTLPTKFPIRIESCWDFLQPIGDPNFDDRLACDAQPFGFFV